eukprot:9177888-Ditylum_brightwellii.AAC.1
MVIKENNFPYLDIQLIWKNEELYFSVYIKKNQTIKKTYFAHGEQPTLPYLGPLPAACSSTEKGKPAP